MAVSTAQATAMLGALPGTLYVQPHSGDPGAAGTLNTIAGAARSAFTLPAASGGQRSIVTNVDCPNVPAGASPSHVSYWNGPVGSGSFLFSEPLGVAVTFLYTGTLRFTSQVFTVDTASGGSQTSTAVVADSSTVLDVATGRLLVKTADTTSQADVASAFTGSGANDTSSQSDSSAIRLGVVVSDATSQSDTAARGGAVSDVIDTAAGMEANVIAIVSVNADLISGSDTTTASEAAGVIPEEYVNRVAPATTVAYSGTGAALVTNLQDDPDTSAPVTWITANNGDTSLSVRVSFAPVIGALVAGGAQEFRARVRKGVIGTGTPTARIELWENGSLIRADADVDLTAGDPGTVLSFAWITSEVTNSSNVQCRVVITAQGGTSGDIAAIEWNRRQTIFADEFIGASSDAPDPTEWELYKSEAGETWNMTLSGGKAVLTRPSGGGVGTIAYIRSVQAFPVQSGRYILANVPNSSTTRLFVEGNAGATLGFITSLIDDGEGYTPGVQIYNGADMIAAPVWSAYGSIGQIKVLIVSATQIRVFADGVECADGVITVPSLGTTLHVGLGMRTAGAGLSTSQFDRCEVGMS